MARALPRSPLAPVAFPKMPRIDGVAFSAVASGVKYEGRFDLMLAKCVPGTAVAGVFPRSATRSAPVLDCQTKLGRQSHDGAAILVNAGNSNAFTGNKGVAAVKAIVHATAHATGIPDNRVFTASTGVIGEPLPYDRITAKLSELVVGLSADAINDAAAAILTTDTYPKGAAAHCNIGGRSIKIAGVAKGSGMIAPDMATMLVYIFTDAKVDQDVLQAMTARLCDETFNCITVDSDTSTSDSLMVAATGASGVDASADPNFEAALHSVMLDLAHQVVRDGEGATKFVEIKVKGATDKAAAKTHAMSIANSPLVKTAIAGQDPNVTFLNGVFQSFGDAPNGFSEELNELTWALGAEYWYRDVFAFRAGYFNEHETKGARKFFSLGAGFKYTTINIDISYLISTSKVVSPLEGTLRFGLTFNFGDEYDEY